MAVFLATRTVVYTVKNGNPDKEKVTYFFYLKYTFTALHIDHYKVMLFTVPYSIPVCLSWYSVLFYAHLFHDIHFKGLQGRFKSDSCHFWCLCVLLWLWKHKYQPNKQTESDFNTACHNACLTDFLTEHGRQSINNICSFGPLPSKLLVSLPFLPVS